tara:strand:+ start:6617 stop:7603 length:987 start_codon:yes stop_codon:yes gene_type:complete
MNSEPSCILFKGLGGAGQRHLRLLREKFPKTKMIGLRKTRKTPLLNGDFSINQTESLDKKYNIEIFSDPFEAYSHNPDLTIISTPSIFHSSDIIEAANYKSNIIVEKPGAMDSFEAKKIEKAVLKNDVELLISYQRRFHPLINELRNSLSQKLVGTIRNVNAITNSYVPDWHPYENFLDLYACRSDLGGGVISTEIHEIDLITWIFGESDKISVTRSNTSGYELDVEDTATIKIEYHNLDVIIDLCFMSKNLKRSIYFYGDNGEIHLDFINQVLKTKIYDAEETIVEKVLSNDEMFKNQINFFFQSEKYNRIEYIKTLKRNSRIIENR